MTKVVFIFMTFWILNSCSRSDQNKNSLLSDQIDQRFAKIEQEIKDTKPSLSGIMSGIQRHHTKLYYAGARENWKLAKYELEQIKQGLEHAAYSYSSVQPGPSMMNSDITKLESSLDKHSVSNFTRSFDGLTHSCNQCHQQMGHEFIVVTIPGPGMFMDQKFRQ